ncbi:MAG: hypothetical protein O7C60_02155 [Rickettsia endosymbiont of Ixodes persulcatus]|nr:hypothetical protein [Rickettsia endosymbiont of Ixodes persulcatus]
MLSFYHRELKQTCGIERCQARTGRAQRNHICLAVFAWLDMNKRRINKKNYFISTKLGSYKNINSEQH